MKEKGRSWFPQPEDPSAAIVLAGVAPEYRTMPLDKVFWSHFTPNLGITGWILGLLLAAAHLDLRVGIVVIVLGNVLGTIPVALLGMLGPKTGLTQIENSRLAFGRDGIRLPAICNWAMCIGFNATGNIPMATALAAFFALGHVTTPFWLALLILQGGSMLVGVYGHHLVQVILKFNGYIALATYGFIAIVALRHSHGAFVVSSAVEPREVALGFALIASNAISWAPYSSDYTRYASQKVKGSTVFGATLVAIVVACSVSEALGMLTATSIRGVSPGPLIANIVALAGGFKPLVLLTMVLGALGGNSINDTTGSYSLISAGVRVPRPVAAAVTGLLCYAIAVAVVTSGSFTAFSSQFFLVILYWVPAWAGISIADGYAKRGGRDARPVNWAGGTTIFLSVTIVTVALFSSSAFYEGPIAKLLGGVDISYFVGFFGAALLYWVFARRSVRAPDADERGMREVGRLEESVPLVP